MTKTPKAIKARNPFQQHMQGKAAGPHANKKNKQGRKAKHKGTST